jgi:uncharacterized protein (TIGR03437 family)
LTICHAQSANQWRQLAPLEGGSALALLELNGIILAGTTSRGVFASSDNGKTWSASSNGLGNLTVNALAPAGPNVLAGTSSGIYRSGDGGRNWTLAVAGSQFIRPLLVTGAGVFAGNSAGRIYRSNDNGQSWAERGTVPNNPSVSALAASGANLFAGTARGVFRSTDQGQTWTAVSNGLPNNAAPIVLALGVNNGTLYAGTNFYRNSSNQPLPQVYASTNNGQSWTAVGDTIVFSFGGGIGYAGVSQLAFEGTNVYALTGFGAAVFNGQAWSEYLGNSGLSSGVGVNFLLRGSGATLLGTTGGVYLNDGQRWTVSNGGLTAASVNALAVSGEVIVASAGASGLFRSTNNGQSWTRSLGVDNGAGRIFPVSNLVVKGEIIYAATSGGVYRSTDRGANWTPLNFGLPGSFPPITDLAASETDVYAISVGSLYKLNGNGGEWLRLTQGDAPFTAIRLAASGANVYASTANSLLRSTNGGESFAPASVGATLNSTSALAARGANVYLGAAASNTPYVFVSENNGQNFTPSKSSFAFNRFALGGSALYAGNLNDGVFFSADNGNHWTPVNAGLATRAVTALAVKGETVLAGLTGFGVYAAVNPQLQPATLANVSAASFSAAGGLASESIAAAFGTNLAIDTVAATSLPLPVGLQGTRIYVRDSAGAERRAPLFFVSPGQVNYQIPPGSSVGEATIIALSGDGASALGKLLIAPVAPGLFAANANGQGVAAAVALRVKADGSQNFEPVAQFDAAQNRFVAVPIDLGSETDQVFLVLFCTGARFRSALTAVTANIGGVSAQVVYAGIQPNLVGLDQVNARLPRSLIGRGNVDVTLIVDGQMANVVGVNFK